MTMLNLNYLWWCNRNWKRWIIITIGFIYYWLVGCFSSKLVDLKIYKSRILLIGFVSKVYGNIVRFSKYFLISFTSSLNHYTELLRKILRFYLRLLKIGIWTPRTIDIKKWLQFDVNDWSSEKWGNMLWVNEFKIVLFSENGFR